MLIRQTVAKETLTWIKDLADILPIGIGVLDPRARQFSEAEDALKRYRPVGHFDPTARSRDEVSRLAKVGHVQ